MTERTAKLDETTVLLRKHLRERIHLRSGRVTRTCLVISVQQPEPSVKVSLPALTRDPDKGPRPQQELVMRPKGYRTKG